MRNKFEILKLKNRLSKMESKGRTPANCGVMRKVQRQLRDLEER